MIDIIASTGIGIIVGAGLMAWRTRGGVEAAHDAYNRLWLHKNEMTSLAVNAEAAHTRATDSRNVLMARIDRLKDIASSQGSVKSGRIIAVLSGEGE